MKVERQTSVTHMHNMLNYGAHCMQPDCSSPRSQHPNQHGFRKGLSCETQLADTIHELAYSIN